MTDDEPTQLTDQSPRMKRYYPKVFTENILRTIEKQIGKPVQVADTESFMILPGSQENGFDYNISNLGEYYRWTCKHKYWKSKDEQLLNDQLKYYTD